MRWTLIAVALLSAVPVGAAVPKVRLAGVWDGTIGAMQVRACFVHKEYGDHGAYYYRSKLVTIPLIADDKKPGDYTEHWADQNGPRWTIEGVANEVMTGQWNGNGKTLPVRLTSVPTKLGEDETACGSQAFFQPRLAGVRTVRSRATMDGVGITRLALDHRGHFPDVTVASFQIDGSGTATERINRRLREPFEDRETNWLACLRMALNHSAFGGQSADEIDPRLISNRWLSVVETTEYYCGGAHPDGAVVPILFDRTTGKETDPLSFVANRKALFAEIFRRSKPRDKECAEAVRGAYGWSAELTRAGMTFRPQLPRVVQACSDDIAIPFARLAPWLNAKGKAAVATLPR